MRMQRTVVHGYNVQNALDERNYLIVTVLQFRFITAKLLLKYLIMARNRRKGANESGTRNREF